MKIKQSETNKEVFNQYRKIGMSILQSRLLASRLNEYNPNFLNPKLSNIDNPKLLNFDKAVDRIVSAIKSDSKIGLCCDHDADGVNSMAVLCKSFKEVFNHHNIIKFSSNRLEGYGIVDSVVDRINKENCDLIITADLGSSDSERIKNVNCDVIVTDHHIVLNGCPNAYDIINPHVSDYTDKICGCSVAWLLMIGVANKMKIDNRERLLNLLNHVSVATIADMMDLSDLTNRFFVKSGFEFINSDGENVFRAYGKDIDEETVGFEIAPAINSISRMKGDSTEAVDFLLSPNLKEARRLKRKLTKANKERKEESKLMTERAELINSSNSSSIVFYHKDNMSGICGIAAGRIADKHGKPTTVFADTNGDSLAGSIRSGSSINVNKVLTEININHPKLLISFGGHAYACGLKIKKDNLDLFIEKFDEYVGKEDCEESIIFYDGNLKIVNMDIYNQIREIAPFGQGFLKPKFLYDGIVSNVSPLGKDTPTIHVSCFFGENKAVCFNSNENYEYLMDMNGKNIKCLYTISLNNFMGRKTLQLIIDKIIK